MQEEWKRIEEFPSYEISNLGNVRNFWYKRHLTCRDNGKGYLVVHFKVNSKVYTRYVHRLVAVTFLGKSDYDVDHIDNNKSNNKVDNLQYVSHSENLFLIRKRQQPDSFMGVVTTKSGFIAQTKVGSVRVLQSYHKTALEAARAYDKFVIANGLDKPLNNV